MSNFKNYILLVIYFISIITINIQVSSAETVNIGLLLGSNSILSEEATQISNGVKLASKAIGNDSAKQYKFNIIEKDTKLNPDKAIQAFNEIASGRNSIAVDSNGVKYIIGPQSTNEVTQLAPLAKNSGVILITPSARSDNISMINEFVFRTRHSQEQESKFFAPFILKEIQKKPLHVLILDSFAGYALVQAFKPIFSKMGGNFGVFEDLSVDRPNYRQIMHKLEANNAKYVYVVSLGVQVADLMMEADYAGLNLKFFGSSDNYNNIIIERAGKLAEGFSFPYAFDPEHNQTSASFAIDYKVSFGSAASQASANAYDAAMLLSMCLEKVGNDSNAVKSCLYYVRNYAGAGGPLSIDRDGNCRRQLHIKTVRGGKFVTLEG